MSAVFASLLHMDFDDAPAAPFDRLATVAPGCYISYDTYHTMGRRKVKNAAGREVKIFVRVC